MILHIPHNSNFIPSNFRRQFSLDDKCLTAELLKMTDAYTADLFSCDFATSVVFPYSRLLVDTERFYEDSLEPMAKVGMGWIYTLTSNGDRLRKELSYTDIQELRELYDCHHKALSFQVQQEVILSGTSLIIDCHSFPSSPLPCDQNQQLNRPDFCIGSDPFHTPQYLIDTAKDFLEGYGYSVGLNTPYAGSIVPQEYYLKNSSVSSIMIEVSRSLYMNERTGEGLASYLRIKDVLNNLLKILGKAKV